VSGYDLGFAADAESGKLRNGMLHHVPIALAAHDHADLNGLLLSSHLLSYRFAADRCRQAMILPSAAARLADAASGIGPSTKLDNRR
jgi:hypothetical protein